MKCPVCGKTAKPVKSNLGWYSCNNVSCNLPVFEVKSQTATQRINEYNALRVQNKLH